MNKPNHTPHRYQVNLIPSNLAAEDVEPAFEAGQLPKYPLHAASGQQAAVSAKAITGMRVHSVERIDDLAPIKTKSQLTKRGCASAHIGYVGKRGEFIPLNACAID